MVAFLSNKRDMELLLLGLCTYILTLTVQYYAWEFNSLTIIISIIVTAWVCRKAKRPAAQLVTPKNQQPVIVDTSTTIIALIQLSTSGILIGAMLAARTGQAVASPWQHLSPAVFMLFALGYALLLYLSKHLPIQWWRMLFHIQVFVTVSVVSLIIKHGYGFDPFIHRASVEQILQTGTILPKQPYYVGQYMLEATVKQLLHIPIAVIDTWLLPIFATILIPWFTLRVLPASHAALLLILPLCVFTFTVPHNLAALLLLTMCFLLSQKESQPSQSLLIPILAFTCLTLHPLLGIPAVALACTHQLALRWPTKQTAFLIILVCVIGLALPGMFILRQYLNQQTVGFLNPFTRSEYFAALFRDPFPTPNIPLAWTVFYTCKLYAGVPLFFAYMWSIIKCKEQLHTRILTALAIGLGIATFLISTSIYIPEIIWYEQSEFAFRLLGIIPFVLAPVALQALSTVSIRSFIIPIALLATCTWYVTYPQINPKITDVGWSVSDADYEVATFVQNKHQTTSGKNNTTTVSYIVVANQMTSVAALDQLGFGTITPNNQFPFGFGSTSPLGQTYLQMVWEMPDKKIILEAMKQAGATTGYLAVSSYWWNAEDIINTLKPQALQSYSIHGGDIQLLEFAP